MWGGFAVFWEWSVIRIDAPIIFKLWGIPFVLVGLYLVVGRFFADAYRRANTYYGVSTQRVLIITRGVSGKVKSLNLKGLSDMSFSVSSSGPGVIQFGSTPSRGSTLLGSSGWPGLPSPPMFELAEETHRVYDLIRQAQQKAA
jgi:hypothetical protein